MTGDGSTEAATQCAILPDTFGPGLLGDVARIPDNYTAVLPYRTDREALQALLPAGLMVAGEPIVSYRFRRAEGIDWADSVSHFVGISTTVEVACADGTRRRGMHFLMGWEDDAMTAILGREVAGTVKLPASIAYSPGVRGEDRCLVHHYGRPLVEIVCRKTGEIKGEALADLRSARREGCTIGYKGLPSVDGKTMGEHYATAVPTVTEVDAAWHVGGHVALFETSPETARWHHRAVRALRSLPLLEPLPGIGTYGCNSLDLSRASRLT